MTPRFLQRTLAAAAAVLSLAFCASAQAVAVTSLRLTDKVSASGRGSINLLTDVSAAALEAYRQQHITSDNRRYLSFGVDVNEAAKGLEKSSSQAVTVASATLTVVRSGVTTQYTQFMTRTQALLRPQGSTVRAPYYTLLGEGGSSRITGSNSVQNAFDSTLNVFVPDDLSNATSAVLEIRFLDVNKNVGEPEAFYDYSGGYEDLAILNNQDATFINTTLPTLTTFASEAPAAETTTLVALTTTPLTVASWSYFPSATQWYFTAYEDSYPQRGDYDFNDLVVAWRYRWGLNASGQVVRVDGDAILVSRGASWSHDWSLRVPFPATASGQVTCTVQASPSSAIGSCPAASSFSGPVSLVGFSDTRALLPGNSGDAFRPWAANTVRGSSFTQGPKFGFSLALSAPVAPSSIGAMDPWLYVRDSGQQVHLAEVDAAYKDSAGFPFALTLPPGWQPPAENVDLGLAYPAFMDFVGSGGTQATNWFLLPDTSRIYGLPNSWSW